MLAVSRQCIVFARYTAPTQKTTSHTKINDNVFILIGGVGVRFVVLLPSSNYPKLHNILFVILTLRNDIANSLAIPWKHYTNWWERHSELVRMT